MILRGYCIEEESDNPGISELLRENLPDHRRDGAAVLADG